MRIYLKTLEFWTDKKDGWQSNVLRFGDQFTYISGENTCGKTPLIKGIMFCLGVSVTFREDISTNCTGVKLFVNLNGSDFCLEREFLSKDFIKVTNISNNEIKKYKVESEYSKFLLGQLEFPETVTTNSNGSSHLIYFSFLAPLFWKDQIDTWHTIYNSSFRFIKDMREESLRYLLGLSPKNPYGLKSKIKNEKKNINKLTETISGRNEFIQELGEIFDARGDVDIAQLEVEKESIKSRLESLNNDFSAFENVSDDFDSAISSKKKVVSEKKSVMAELESKINSFKHIVYEVDAEVETLALNDEAANRFRNFNEICEKAECCLFLASKESYGKSLLYLKDQIKDLAQNIHILKLDKEKLNNEILVLEAEIEKLEKDKKSNMKKSGANKLGDAISLNAKRLVDIETKIKGYEQVTLQKDRLANLVLERDKSYSKIENLENNLSSSSDKKIAIVQNGLSRKINEWIKTLETTGISENASIESGFKYKFGNESYTDLDGSLRIRAVLAFHAALFEYCLENNLYHPRILILDTPKQQELNTNNLKDYFDKLKRLCEKFPDIQVVFSSSEYDFIGDLHDEIWEPSFIGEKHPMYLGVKI